MRLTDQKRRFAFGIGRGLLVFFIVVGAYFASQRLSGNFHTVVPGEFYRSGQLNDRQISYYAVRNKIKTIINLRGRNAGAHWYDAEIAVTRTLGINHIDFQMSARRDFTALQTAELIALMRRVQKTILVHCDWGADRSGLASALYLGAIKKAPPLVAEKQLSIRFGHISLSFIPEYAMDRSLATVEASW